MSHPVSTHINYPLSLFTKIDTNHFTKGYIEHNRDGFLTKDNVENFLNHMTSLPFFGPCHENRAERIFEFTRIYNNFDQYAGFDGQMDRQDFWHARKDQDGDGSLNLNELQTQLDAAPDRRPILHFLLDNGASTFQLYAGIDGVIDQRESREMLHDYHEQRRDYRQYGSQAALED